MAGPDRVPDLTSADRDDEHPVVGPVDARDLHDHVIQRLFATGVSLDVASRLSDREAVVERVNTAITDLDETIEVLRLAIVELVDKAPPA